MNDPIEYFVGIDNSESGAIAIIDQHCNPVAHCKMPMVGKNNEVDHRKVLEFIESHGCYEHNCLSALEQPWNFALGKSAARVMWYCFGKLQASLDLQGLNPHYPLSVTWQSPMLGAFPKGKSKEAAAAKVLEIWGKPFAKTKKESGGINDAYLIDEWLRREHQRLW